VSYNVVSKTILGFPIDEQIFQKFQNEFISDEIGNISFGYSGDSRDRFYNFSIGIIFSISDEYDSKELNPTVTEEHLYNLKDLCSYIGIDYTTPKFITSTVII
jgi:hypothetical protein